jgi:hypothetical protein
VRQDAFKGEQIYAWKLEGKMSLGRPRHRWEVNTRITLQETRWKVEEWIYLAEDTDRGLVVRVSDYISRGPGLDSRPYQIF